MSGLGQFLEGDQSITQLRWSGFLWRVCRYPVVRLTYRDMHQRLSTSHSGRVPRLFRSTVDLAQLEASPVRACLIAFKRA